MCLLNIFKYLILRKKHESDLFYYKNVTKMKFYHRVVISVICFSFSFYITAVLFNVLKTPLIMHLTNLDRCPACYGVSICAELYSNSIILDTTYRWSNIFNVKNVFYGYTKSNRRVVLKKLAHTSEFQKFDDELCKNWGLSNNCKPNHLMEVKNVEQKIKNLVNYDVSLQKTEVKTGLVLCPYTSNVLKLISQIVGNKTLNNSDMINAWTILKINPEPLVIQLIPKSHGWPVPAFGGVCGRLEVVAYEGEPLSSLLHIQWYNKLNFGIKILEAAIDFTFKHESFRLYLMDWSLDNIVANEKNDVTFVDLEDVIVLDKHITPMNDLPNWHKIHSEDWRGPEYSFSIENICKHHLSDYNLWAACYILSANETPLLYPIPTEVTARYPNLNLLLKKCLNEGERFQTVANILDLMKEIFLMNKL